MDYCSTNFDSGSTGNAPKMPNESSMLETCMDEVYAIAQVSDNDKEVDKPKKTVSQNLTPVRIMVVDIIPSVRSRTLLRVLLDSGSTTTLINKRCLPRNCMPQKIASSRIVNTLAGSTKVVIMGNLRLPEFDKNRNVNQQKALAFQSETCKYNVILGADFFDKNRH
jgi:hypothetical protein